MKDYFLQKIEVKGAQELERVLKAMPNEVGSKLISQSNRKGANILKEALKATAPVGPSAPKVSKKGKVYGKLKDSIKVTVKRTGDATISMSVHIGGAYWGMFSEFGTSKQPAQPWFRPTFETKKEDIIKTITTDLYAKVVKTAERLAGPYAKAKRTLGVRK